MIWLQAVGCFLIWAMYAIARTRRTHRVRNWARRIPRAWRGILAGGLFVVPAGLLGLLIILVAKAHLLSAAGLTPAAWVAVVFGGLIYVHAQTLATALLVTLAEPRY